MTRRPAPIYRLLVVGALVPLVVAACGGRSFDRDEGASGGRRPMAGSGVGARDTAGVGGTSAGGSSAAGGSIGIAWPPECSAPAESGPCNAYFQRWYLDIGTGICKPFVFGGCSGNTNNYESREACQEACPSTNPSYDHCDVASDCMVASPDCCGVCDGPDLTSHSLIAYARRYEMEAQPSCTGLPCGECVPPASGHTLKYFVPDCVNHQCTVVDIRQSLVSACQADQDCSIRYGTECCPSCDPGQRVAISNHQLLQELVCNGDQLCPTIECDAIDDGAQPFCADGHCTLRLPGVD